METQLQNQTALELNITFKDIVPTHALVTNIQMKNGKQTAITTLFCCSEFSFEEINRGVRDSLNRQNWIPIDKSQGVLYSLKDGSLNEELKFIEDQY